MSAGKGGKKGSSKKGDLSFQTKSIWDGITKAREKKVYDFSKGYMEFLDRAKTEREAIEESIVLLESCGFKRLDKVKTVKAGDRVYTTNRGKNLAAFVVGTAPLSEGLNIVASHVDSPRLDLKQNPLYEDGETNLALLRTHYYGGIRKYQWVNIPLALHGRVVLANGKTVDIRIGEDPADPVFIITDLLPHLSKKQNERKLPTGIKGEELCILVGSIPVKDKKTKKKVKQAILEHLNRTYTMVEEDFISAELEVVPAGKAVDIGLDRSMVGAYGQDDRICGYTSVVAICDIKKPRNTALVLLFDKEETGSEGTTGVKSRFLENAIGDLMEKTKPDYRDRELRLALERSRAVSSDVNAGVNPLFKGVHEMQNAAKLGHGIVVTKFTGSGGKFLSNDASAEFMSYIRLLFNRKKVPWQPAELGKVDEGGGGTVAKFLAQHNMDVVDCGPALLSMHSPMEISSKADVYAVYQAYTAFLQP